MAEGADEEKDEECSENAAHRKSRSKTKHAPAPGALNNSYALNCGVTSGITFELDRIKLLSLTSAYQGHFKIIRKAFPYLQEKSSKKKNREDMAHIDELLFTIKREDKPTGMKGSTLLKLDCSGSEIAKRGRLIIREVALRGSAGGQAKRTPLSILPFATKHIHISCATIFNEFDSQIQLSQPVGGASVGGGRIGTPRKATMEFTLEDNRFWGVEDLRVSVHGSLISKWKGKGKGAASKTENKKEHHKKEKEKEKGKERKKEKKERKEKKKMGNDQAGEVKQQGDEEGEREWTKKLKVIGGYKNEWCNLSTELVIAAEPKVITKAGFALYRYSWGKVDEGEETTPTTTTAITTATTTDESKEKHKEEDTQHAQQLQGDGIASPSKKKKKKKTTPPTPSKTWRSTTAREAEIAVGGQLDVDMTKLFASPPPSSSWLDVKGRGVDINNLALAHTESVPGTMLKRVSAMYMKGTGHGRGIGLANFCQMNDKLSIAMDMKWTPWTDKGLVPEVTLTSVKKVGTATTLKGRMATTGKVSFVCSSGKVLSVSTSSSHKHHLNLDWSSELDLAKWNQHKASWDECLRMGLAFRLI